MKKVLAILLSVLLLFSAVGVTAMADEPEPATDEIVTIDPLEEETTRNIVSDDGTMVVPINFTQLRESFVFKIIEKIINFFLGIFGSSMDDFLSGGISNAGDFLDEAISNIDGSLPTP